MRVSPPANPLVLLPLCVVSVSLCQQLVQLLLRLAAQQPSRQPVLLPRLLSPDASAAPSDPSAPANTLWRISPSRYPFGSLNVFVLILRLF